MFYDTCTRRSLAVLGSSAILALTRQWLVEYGPDPVSRRLLFSESAYRRANTSLSRQLQHSCRRSSETTGGFRGYVGISGLYIDLASILLIAYRSQRALWWQCFRGGGNDSTTSGFPDTPCSGGLIQLVIMYVRDFRNINSPILCSLAGQVAGMASSLPTPITPHTSHIRWTLRMDISVLPTTRRSS